MGVRLRELDEAIIGRDAQHVLAFGQRNHGGQVAFDGQFVDNVIRKIRKRIAGGYLAKSDWPKLELAAQSLRDVSLWIDDTPGITALELSAKARRLKQERGLDLVMVDYMQLMSGGAYFNSRNEEVSAISEEPAQSRASRGAAESRADASGDDAAEAS